MGIVTGTRRYIDVKGLPYGAVLEDKLLALASEHVIVKVTGDRSLVEQSIRVYYDIDHSDVIGTIVHLVSKWTSAMDEVGKSVNVSVHNNVVIDYWNVEGE